MKKSFKISSILILIAIIWLLIDFCLYYMNNSSEPEDWRTKYKIHEKVISDIDTIVLLDVQGMHGGQNVWLSHNGELYAQLIKPAHEDEYRFKEKRIKIKLTSEEQNIINKIFNDSDFLRVKIQQRGLVPDEALPILWLKTKGGRIAAAAKPDSDENPQFDPIYYWLVETINKKGITSTYIGQYDSSWWPKGFPSPYTVGKAVEESSHLIGFDFPEYLKKTKR